MNKMVKIYNSRGESGPYVIFKDWRGVRLDVDHTFRYAAGYKLTGKKKAILPEAFFVSFEPQW